MREAFSPSSSGAVDSRESSAITAENKIAIACCAAAMVSLVPVALVQLKVIDHLPDPPGKLFDSMRIVNSQAAYRFGVPDGVLGLASYGATMALLMTASPERPTVQRMLRAKLALDAGMAARNARKQVTQFGRICSWCMGTALATAGVVYFARRARLPGEAQSV